MLVLSYTKEKCDSCGKCIQACPHRPKNSEFMGCAHCNPEDAKCALACPQGAIQEVSKGVLGVNEELCDGCGKCAEACGCIEIKDGKAIKCDLCSSRGFEIECAAVCNSGALSVGRRGRELKDAEKTLGWYVHSEDYVKRLKEEEEYGIGETHTGERIYKIKNFPELSSQEAWLINSVMGQFREEQSESELGKLVENTLGSYCEQEGIIIDKEQEGYLNEILGELIFGYGPLSRLLSNENLEEIAVIGLGRNRPVYVYDCAFGWLRTNLYFCNEECVRNTVNKMARGLGRRLTMQTPRLNAVLENGSRLCASIEPVAISGPSVTIRKFASKRFTPLDLIRTKTASAEAIALIWTVMQTDCSVLVCGNTGSGKTTTLNSLFSFVPSNERIIVTEETPEIKVPHRHFVKMNVADSVGIGMESLITDTLRMRPDRVIVGEIRHREEVSAFIDTLLAGQGRGSYATFHAQSGREALTRLLKLGVSAMDLSAIDLVVVQRRWSRVGLKGGTQREIRRVTEISEVVRSNEGEGAELNTIYKFNHKKDKLVKVGELKQVSEKMQNVFGMNNAMLKKEISRRARKLSKMSKREISAEEFFSRVNKNEV